jgi:hypothetical protein
MGDCHALGLALLFSGAKWAAKIGLVYPCASSMFNAGKIWTSHVDGEGKRGIMLLQAGQSIN